MYCIGAICTVISYIYPLCRASWVEERYRFITYLSNLDTSCYELGAKGEGGCYDCTGAIQSYFTILDGDYKPVFKLNTREARGHAKYGPLKELTIDTARTGDLVLHTPIEGKSDNTHTAVFIRKVGDNKIEIMDTFVYKKRMSTRVVPYKGNIHNITFVGNPRLE